jgi:outer membrane protein OmpA-like peptidoglycan-associated protein
MCAHCEEEREQHGHQRVDRKTEGGSATIAPSVAASIQSLRGGGSALPSKARAFFEPRFGADFSSVRVHTGARAEHAARSIAARAFTVGHDIAFGAGQYFPDSDAGRRLLAHELTHVVQQTGSGVRQPSLACHLASEVIQRAGDPAKIPPGLPCPTDLTPGRPAGTDLRFSLGGSAISPAHTATLTAFRGAWLAAGGTDDITVHGYASTIGEQGANWTLSCDRAVAVRAELIRLGIPPVRISVVAHGESTDFGGALAPNQHAVVSSSASFVPLPLVTGVLTAADSFAGRSTTRFGVGETVSLSFFSLPPRPAVDFGGLDWVLVTGGGAITPSPVHDGTGTYVAPAAAGPVTLELRVAAGATAGRVVSTHPIAVVAPSKVRMTDIPGTAPNFSPGGPIPPGRWGAGFRANIFIDPKEVSFRGVVFTEGTTTATVTGSFLSVFPKLHTPGSPVAGGGGNLATGTQLVGFDRIFTGSRLPTTSFPFNICGGSDYLWRIPWSFSVSGSPPALFDTASQLHRSTFGCDAFVSKGGAGPFKRSI